MSYIDTKWCLALQTADAVKERQYSRSVHVSTKTTVAVFMGQQRQPRRCLKQSLTFYFNYSRSRWYIFLPVLISLPSCLFKHPNYNFGLFIHKMNYESSMHFYCIDYCHLTSLEISWNIFICKVDPTFYFLKTIMHHIDHCSALRYIYRNARSYELFRLIRRNNYSISLWENKRTLMHV